MEEKLKYPETVRVYPTNFSGYLPKVTGLNKPMLTNESIKGLIQWLNMTGMPTIFID